jgi:hypothetical protein
MRGRAAWWKFDVRRIWVCPLCSRRVKTGGDVVNQPCDCLAKSNVAKPVWMQLVEPSPQPAELAGKNHNGEA